jgi:hypothetical protein
MTKKPKITRHSPAIVFPRNIGSAASALSAWVAGAPAVHGHVSNASRAVRRIARSARRWAMASAE